MELEDEAFFMRSHASTLEARVEVIDPSETAALSCAVEACMVITGVKQKDSWLEKVTFLVATLRKIYQYVYLSLDPPPLKPDTLATKSQRRSPNKRTVHTSCKSSCSVHGPLRVSSLTVTISTLRYNDSTLTLFAPTLYRSGAGLLALLPLRACGLQFQDEILDELQFCLGEED